MITNEQLERMTIGRLATTGAGQLATELLAARRRIAELEADRERLQKLTSQAADVIDGLSDQQATADDWYVVTLEQLRDAACGRAGQ